MRTMILIGMAAACAILVPAPAGSAQSFDLVEPGGAVTGRILIQSGNLTYWDIGGERVRYRRNKSYDTPDGRFIGYYNTPLARVLKFPRSGVGRFLYADLDDPFPADAYSFRHVHRTRTQPVWPLLPVGPVGPFLPPGPLNPVGPLIPTGPLLPVPPPTQSVLLDSQRVPLPDLPPAQLKFFNGGNREIEVTMRDARNPGAVRSMRIAPGTSQPVTLHRDAGEQLIERFDVVTPAGDIITEEKTHVIPPPRRYELTVHQWRVQSVAIDRTEGANNAIEDVNFQGQAVGRFRLPPGPQLHDGTIDVFQEARSMGNQGAVAPLVPKEDLPGDPVSPLERALMQQKRAGAF